MAHLVLVTGLPGSGKSTFAKKAYPNYAHLETDQLFVQDGVYKFDPSKLGEYHCETIRRAENLIFHGFDVVVSNTFSRKWEIEPYLKLTDNYTIFYMKPPVHPNFPYLAHIELLAARNVHSVPFATIVKMNDRWEPKEGEIIVNGS